MRSGPRFLIAGLLVAGALAGAEPDATQYLPPDPVAVVRLHDLPRSAQRWDGSPYPALLATPWGASARAALDSVLADPAVAGCDAAGVLKPLRRVAIGVAVDRAAPDPAAVAEVGLALSTAGDADPIVRLCGALFPVEAPLGHGQRAWLDGTGQMSELGSLFVYRTTPPAARLATPEPAGEPLRITHPEACIEAELQPEGLAVLLRALAQPGAETGAGPRMSIAVSVDAIGLRERTVLPFPAGQAQALGGLAWPAAPRAALDGLPASTLSALTLRFAPAVTARGLAAMRLDETPALRALAPFLAWNGLPRARTLLEGLDGDCVLWLAEGVPLPSANAVIGMTPEVARRVLAVLGARMNLQVADDGSLRGRWGPAPFACAYREGRLVLTTDPAGVVAAQLRPGGFTDHAQIRAALAEVPADALACGVSRSGGSWGALADMAMLPIATLQVPELLSLPRDLRIAGRHGFLSWRVIDGSVVIESGGLFGGPCSLYALITGAGIGGAILLAPDAGQEPQGAAGGMQPEELVF